MKSKTKTYLLLMFVLGIWGTIGYKLVNGMSSDIVEVQQDDFDVVFNPKATTEADTFFIQNLKRDPFLGTLSRKNKKSMTSEPIKKVVEKMPLMTYNGLVKNQSASDQVFVININNKQYLLKKGQIADSVKLIKGNEKEVIIRYQNKNQTIKRQ